MAGGGGSIFFKKKCQDKTQYDVKKRWIYQSGFGLTIIYEIIFLSFFPNGAVKFNVMINCPIA